VLLNSLMVLARSQQALPRRETVDLAVAARAAEEVTAAEAARRGVSVQLDMEPAPIIGDPALIERLVANLVENAVRHNVLGGCVQVKVRPGLVEVENTGAAIRPEDVRRLAEPFERLHRDTTGPGAGLGLSIVRAVADAHDAELLLEPRAGGGLVASVRFTAPHPVAHRPAVARPAAA
jgi:signal transduction histidine kinase